ncbi:MAG TPA: dihydrofolate reductase family protein [Acidimicrobiia bacterium]
MGKLIVTEFVTLDGVAQGPGQSDEDRDEGFEHGGWQAPLAADDTGDDVMFEQASHMDALLLGRKTYDIFSAFWPNAPEEFPFTRLLNTVPKYVASRTLTDPLAWQGSTVLGGDLAKSVAALKDRYSELHIIGSLNLLQSLLQLGLVDRVSLWMYPIVLGSGKRVFGDGTIPAALHLADSHVYPNGTVHLTYETAGAPTYANMTFE